jgi:hypothetical protein
MDMEAKMALPREYLEFTIWYLKEKELVRRDENTSEILISAKGIDFAEQNLPSSRIVYKLLKSGNPGGAVEQDEPKAKQETDSDPF